MCRSHLLVIFFVGWVSGCKKPDAINQAPIAQPAKAIEPAFTLKTPFAGKSGDGIIEVSTTADGRYLAVSGYTKEKNIQVWDLSTKQPIGHFSIDLKGPHAKLFPDGSRILSTWEWNRLLLCDPRTGEKKGELKIPQNDSDPGGGGVISDIRLSANGTMALAVTFKRLLGWDLASGKTRFEWQTPGAVSLSELFANDKRIVIGNDKGELAIWDLEQGKSVQKLSLPSGKDVESVAVSSDGVYLAGRSGSSAATNMYVWDLRSGDVIHEFGKQEFMPGSSRMTFLPDKKTLAYADNENALVLFDVSTKSACYRNAGTPGHSGDRLWCMNVTSDGETLVVGYENGNIKVFDLRALSQP
jgi:WD40 repeat protein